MKYEIKSHQCLVKIFIIAWCIVLLGGCQRYSCWLKGVFNQGQSSQLPLEQAKDAIRSLRIYNQVNTLCNMDILLLNQPVITTANTIAASLGLNNPEHTYDQYINFYILATTSNGLLSDPSSQWHISLEINGTMFKPIELKTIVLPHEYRIIFNDLYNKYKQAYSVKFNSLDQQGNRLLDQTQRVTLKVKRLGKQGQVSWPMLHTYVSSFNKDRLAYDITTTI